MTLTSLLCAQDAHFVSLVDEPCPPMSRYSGLRPQPLPVEILDQVFQRLNRHNLFLVLQVNKAFCSISTRVLYRDIDDLKLRQSVASLQTLDKNPKLVQLVRSLQINWEGASPTQNLYRLLHRVLQQLSRLRTLHLVLPKGHYPFWILSNCTFSLRSFTTSLPCNDGLAEFLDHQPSIVELFLRGLDGDVPCPGIISTPPGTPVGEVYRFPLHPTSLPKLSQFRAIHAKPSTIATVAAGRPIRMAAIPIFPTTALEALKALSTSISPLKGLSIMSFDADAPEYLLSEIVKRFPDLEALHVVVPLSELPYVCLYLCLPKFRVLILIL